MRPVVLLCLILTACGPEVPSRGQAPAQTQRATKAQAEAEPDPGQLRAPRFTPDPEAPAVAKDGARVRPGVPIVTGPLDPTVVRAGIRERFAKLLGCYAAALPAMPELAGVVTIEFTIDRNGEVTEVEARNGDFAQPRVPACMARGISRWTFPAPAQAGNTEVSLPFELEPDPESRPVPEAVPG